jgi:glycine betaine/proline transport system ATP-binding protein
MTEIIKKMDEESLWYAFMVSEDQQVQGVVDYRGVNVENGDRPVDKANVITEFPMEVQDTFLESLISIAAESPLPIAITDQQRRLVGVISRERLLECIAT